MRGNAPQVVEALWAAKEEPPAKLVGFSFFMFWGLRPIVCMGHKGGGLASLRWPDRVVGAAHRGHKVV